MSIREGWKQKNGESGAKKFCNCNSGILTWIPEKHIALLGDIIGYIPRPTAR